MLEALKRSLESYSHVPKRQTVLPFEGANVALWCTFEKWRAQRARASHLVQIQNYAGSARKPAARAKLEAISYLSWMNQTD